MPAKMSAGFRNTELHRAVANGDTTKVIALLQSLSDPNVTDSEGQTALHYACSRGHLQVAELLLSNRYGRNNKKEEKSTCRKGDPDKVPIDARTHLINVSANSQDLVRINTNTIPNEAPKIDINAGDRIGWTPLHFAVWNGHKEVIQLLLQAHARPCAEDNQGQTPLHIAAARGNIEVMALLVEAGSKITVRDKEGHTPQQIFALEGHGNIERWLEYVVKRAAERRDVDCID
jgi:ankyrin repeat protein